MRNILILLLEYSLNPSPKWKEELICLGCTRQITKFVDKFVSVAPLTLERIMMDEMKRQGKLLRPGYSSEFNGKGVKSINRKIAKQKLKEKDRKDFRKE